MKHGVYGIVDLVAAQYVGGVYLHPHPAAAIRMFRDAIGDPKTSIGQHSADYNLMLLGSLDIVTGIFEATGSQLPEVVLTGAAFVAASSDKDM